MKIAITGHRPNKLNNDYDLVSPLILAIEDKIVDIVAPYWKENITFITGMALGIDTLFAQMAIRMHIPFIAAIPCIGQDKMWPEKSRLVYRKILENELCMPHFVTNQPYNPICMELRNMWMVDNCDLLIAVWDNSSGGTYNCIKYAKTKLNDNQIIYINPKTITS